MINLKKTRHLALIAAGALIILSATEVGFNLWIRSSLRRYLTGEAGRDCRIRSKICWLRFTDIFAGKVNRIWVNASNCLLNDLRYSRLLVDSRGFRFSLPVLLKEKRLKIIRMEHTRIIGVISENALNEYLNRNYPGYNGSAKIKPGRLFLSGSAWILKKRVPVELEGNIGVVAEKRLRFYPTRLLIAGRKVSGTLVRIVGRQAPLEFDIIERWPLRITDLILEHNVIKVRIREVQKKIKDRAITNLN